MSAKNKLEKDFAREVRTGLVQEWRGHYQRIESALTGSGIPDTNWCVTGKEIWIEFKIVKGTRVELEPEQVSWHVMRHSHGGTTFILALDYWSGSIRKERRNRMYLWNGKDARQVKDHGVSYPALRIWDNRDWFSLGQVLLSGGDHV